MTIERSYRIKTLARRSRRFCEIGYQLSPCNLFRFFLLSENSYIFHVVADLGEDFYRIFEITRVFQMYPFAFGAHLAEDTVEICISVSSSSLTQELPSLAFTVAFCFDFFKTSISQKYFT